jgi:hypothetical protein
MSTPYIFNAWGWGLGVMNNEAGNDSAKADAGATGGDE